MCKQCNLKPVYEFTNKKKLCKRCFIKYFQKKFLYTIKKFKMIKKGDIIVYKDNNDVKNVVLKEMLRLLECRGIIKLINSNNNRINRIALTDNIDSESYYTINILIKNNASKLKELSPGDKKMIKPLYLLTDEEVILYAKLKNLKFKEKKIQKDKISSFVDDLEKKHPEIKRAIVNSYLELYEK